MPIAALPKDTARVITSTLALNDAASVIKELVDNALDARADTVSIEIAANTLDVVQVKDNGSGIGVEDRQLLCKRGCTSKIRSIEDLASLGGTFLGFRGEALASVTELSSTVTMTTRIEGEVVGTALEFGSDGILLSSSSASHPVGTTVRITDFLSKIPVRKQTALKAATKTITTVRKLLQAYAFARSEVRLSFKVLKAKTEKANWAFAPTKSPDALSEVASKIVGKEVADQCIQDFAQSEDGEKSGSGWQLHALMISPTSDIRNACNSDQYFSVDKRSVNAERGLMKDMLKTYKQFLRNVLTADSAIALTKPFLLVRLSCPPDSYDVNVEPAKDEVLFYNPALVRGLFEQLMEKIYGRRKNQTEAQSSHRTPEKPTLIAASSFDLLLARKPATQPPENGMQDQGLQKPGGSRTHSSLPASMSSRVETNLPGDKSQHAKSSVQQRPLVPNDDGKTHVNMYTMEDDDGMDKEDSTSASPSVREDGEDINSADVRNPWSLAKLNVRLAPKQIGGQDSTNSSTPSPASPFQESSRSPNRVPLGQHTRSPTLSDGDMVPFQNPGPPLRPWAPRATKRGGDSASLPDIDTDQRPKAGNRLDNWIDEHARASNQVQTLQDQSFGQGQAFVHHSQPFSQRQDVRMSPIKASAGRCRGAPQQQRLSLPFKTPFKQDHQRHDTGLHSPQSNLSPERHGHGSSDHQQDRVRPQQTFGTPPSSSQAELDEILEFERQKKVVAAHQRKQLAAKGNWNRPFTLPSPSSQTSTTSPNGAQMYAAVFPNGSAPPNAPGESGETPEDFGSRFAGSDLAQHVLPQQPTPARSNPHHNRYLAAARNLSQPRADTQPNSHAHPEPPSPLTRRRRSFDDPDVAANAIPKISESDPRAYFIRFRQRHAEPPRPVADGLTLLGVRPPRAKTTRLPLESIPINETLHDLIFEMKAPQQIKDFKTSFVALSKIDEYVKSGTVQAVVWSPLSKEVGEWERTVGRLVQSKYRPRLLEGSCGDGASIEDSSAGDFDFELNLSRVLKAFVDGDGN